MPFPRISLLTGERGWAACGINDYDLSLLSARVFSQHFLKRLLGRQAFLQKLKSFYSVSDVGLRLSGDGANIGFNVRHRASNSWDCGGHGHSEG